MVYYDLKLMHIQQYHWNMYFLYFYLWIKVVKLFWLTHYSFQASGVAWNVGPEWQWHGDSLHHAALTFILRFQFCKQNYSWKSYLGLLCQYQRYGGRSSSNIIQYSIKKQTSNLLTWNVISSNEQSAISNLGWFPTSCANL